MTTTSPVDLEDVRRELQDTYREMSSAASDARGADEEAELMRQLALDLETAVDPIRHALAANFTLHTPSTWLGRAATASRNRLDRLDDQLRTAIRLIDQVIVELRTTAWRRESAAATLWQTYEGYARHARALEDVLGLGTSWGIR